MAIILSEGQKQKAIEMSTAGASIMLVCEIIGVTEYSFWQYCEKDPLFDDAFGKSRTRAGHRYADEIVKISENTRLNPQIARNQIQARQWLAGKRNSKHYGDKLDVNVAHTLNIGGILDAAEARVLPMLDHEKHANAQIAEFTETNNLLDTGLEPVTTPKGNDISELV